MKKEIILASTSPRRKELLKQIGLNFKIIPSNYEEDISLKMSHTKLAKTLAYGKASDVSRRVKNGIIIGVDTFLVLGKKRIGKPKDEKNARKMLKLLSGKRMKVYSGVAIIDKYKKREIVDCEITEVKLKKLTDKEIASYVKTKEPLDKAGAFAIQGIGGIFIEEIKGCYTNVIGIPLNNLYKNLNKLGFNILK
jgi:septum formation protein